MAEHFRVERGWIIADATRQDDGSVAFGTGQELRFSPFDALQDRKAVDIPAGLILKASVQRLAFWRR